MSLSRTLLACCGASHTQCLNAPGIEAPASALAQVAPPWRNLLAARGDSNPAPSSRVAGFADDAKGETKAAAVAVDSSTPSALELLRTLVPKEDFILKDQDRISKNLLFYERDWDRSCEIDQTTLQQYPIPNHQDWKILGTRNAYNEIKISSEKQVLHRSKTISPVHNKLVTEIDGHLYTIQPEG